MFEVIEDIKPEKNDSKVLGALAYIGTVFLGVAMSYFAIIVPLLIYLFARDDKFARFHALQCLIVTFILIVISMIVFTLFWLLWMLGIILSAAGDSPVIFAMFPLFFLIFALPGIILLLLYIYWAYLAYQGKAFRLPFVTKFVLKNL